jgi:hypothetical protein
VGLAGRSEPVVVIGSCHLSYTPALTASLEKSWWTLGRVRPFVQGFEQFLYRGLLVIEGNRDDMFLDVGNCLRNTVVLKEDITYPIAGGWSGAPRHRDFNRPLPRQRLGLPYNHHAHCEYQRNCHRCCPYHAYLSFLPYLCTARPGRIHVQQNDILTILSLDEWSA